MNRYFEIQKVDTPQRMVWGYCSTEALDAHGEIITKAAMQDAWDEYMQFGNIREMHQPSAVGVVKEYSFDDTGTLIGAYIADDSAWAKVEALVYKGFSVGGKKKPGGYDAINKTITALSITEISLVDRPANPEALITLFKAQGMENPMKEELVKALGLDPATATPEQCVAKAHALAAAAKAIPQTDTKNTTNLKEPSELRKSVQALAYTGNDIQKGLYTVGRFAELLESLGWLQTSCTYEAENEKDNSPVPGQIASAIAPLANALVAMVQEEAAEFLASLKLPEGTDPIIMLTNVVSNCASAADIRKCADVASIFKAGARNSSADADRIQKAHDLLAELGAACSDTAKSHGHEDIAKAFAVKDQELDAIRKDFAALEKAHDDLQKKYDAKPAEPKGVVAGVVVEKAQDGTPLLNQESEVEPVLKLDGSIDEVATQIKKLHAGGGRPIR